MRYRVCHGSKMAAHIDKPLSTRAAVEMILEVNLDSSCVNSTGISKLSCNAAVFYKFNSDVERLDWRRDGKLRNYFYFRVVNLNQCG